MDGRTLLAAAAGFIFFGPSAVQAGKTIEDVGVIVCVTDKWDETEPEKGHKLADSVQRCVLVQNDASLPSFLQECTGKYEYMPDGSWKSAGKCTNNYKDGDKSYLTWEEGSHLKEYPYKFTGGTGKYQGATGGGTYMYEPVTDTLFGGRYKGKLELP
jgi:hypothetical protein